MPRQRGEIRVVPAAGALRQRADALDHVVERLTLLAPQRLAQQLAQQPHVVSQGFGRSSGTGGVYSDGKQPSALGAGRWALGGWRLRSQARAVAVDRAKHCAVSCRAPTAYAERPARGTAIMRRAAPDHCARTGPHLRLRRLDRHLVRRTRAGVQHRGVAVRGGPIAAVPGVRGRHRVAVVHAENFGERFEPAAQAPWTAHPLIEATIAQARRAGRDVASRSRSTPRCPLERRPAPVRPSRWRCWLLSAISAGCRSIRQPWLARRMRSRPDALGLRVRHPGPDWGGLRRGQLHRDARVPGRRRVSGGAAGADLVGARFAAAARVPRTFARFVGCAPHGDRGPPVGSRLAWLTWRARPPARRSASQPGPRPRPVTSPRSARPMCENTAAQAALHPDLVGAAARAVIGLAQSHGVSGWKVNGAGGDGGSLTLLAGPAAGATRRLVAALDAAAADWRVIPTRLSSEGVRVWEDTGSGPRSPDKVPVVYSSPTLEVAPRNHAARAQSPPYSTPRSWCMCIRQVAGACLIVLACTRSRPRSSRPPPPAAGRRQTQGQAPTGEQVDVAAGVARLQGAGRGHRLEERAGARQRAGRREPDQQRDDA